MNYKIAKEADLNVRRTYKYNEVRGSFPLIRDSPSILDTFRINKLKMLIQKEKEKKEQL